VPCSRPYFKKVLIARADRLARPDWGMLTPFVLRCQPIPGNSNTLKGGPKNVSPGRLTEVEFAIMCHVRPL
jgi:hypothetical protein